MQNLDLFAPLTDTPRARRSASPCTIDGCQKPGRYDGAMCWAHYYRVRRYGRTDPGPRARAPLHERFWRFVVRDDADKCWLWSGATDGHGYGQIGAGTRADGHMAAHRLSYEMHRGSIGPGLDIDHLCRNPLCVNPEHLETVTRGENTRRGRLFEVLKARAAARRECRNGHPRTPENIVRYKDGKPRCLACIKAAQRR